MQIPLGGIISLDQSDTILANLGAGPYEDLMGNHGAQFIARIERCANQVPAFHRMPGIVRKNPVSDDCVYCHCATIVVAPKQTAATGCNGSIRVIAA
jgi:hypothetical protein